MYRILMFCVFTWSLLAGASAAAASADFTAGPPALARRLGELEGSSQPTLAAEPLRQSDRLLDLYRRRAGAPLWLPGGRAGRLADALLDVLSASGREGLDPLDYHGPLLQEALGQAVWPVAGGWSTAAADLEILCTDAVLEYVWQQAGGRAAPDPVLEEGPGERPAVPLFEDFLVFLSGLPAAEQPEQAAWVGTFQRSLQSIKPDHETYRSLVAALADIRRIRESGGWSRILEGPVLHPGQSDRRLDDVRRRLQQTGDWFPAVACLLAGTVDREGDQYDPWLAWCVRGFQRRHGLRDDGVIGPATLAAMNVSAADRERQIIVNLERLRWLPRDLGRRHLLVNIPDFSAALVENGRKVMSMRAMVGRIDRPTPLLSSELSCLVLNPSWHVPQKLARCDLLPKIKQDPGILAAKGFKVYANWEEGAPEVDPAQVDWQAVQAADLCFKFQQVPGPDNPLGTVKFLFPNRFSVFLHDTNQPGRFAESDLCLSSGCVRIEHARALMGALLAPTGNKDEDLSAAGGDQAQEKYVRVPGQVAVHLVYLTTWVDDDGLIEFRPDVYGYDTELSAGLKRQREEQLARRTSLDEVQGSGVGIVAAAYQDLTGPVSR